MLEQLSGRRLVVDPSKDIPSKILEKMESWADDIDGSEKSLQSPTRNEA